MCILYVRRRKLEPSVDVAKVGGLLNAGCVKGTPPLSGRPCMIQWWPNLVCVRHVTATSMILLLHLDNVKWFNRASRVLSDLRFHQLLRLSSTLSLMQTEHQIPSFHVTFGMCRVQKCLNCVGRGYVWHCSPCLLLKHNQPWRQRRWLCTILQFQWWFLVILPRPTLLRPFLADLKYQPSDSSYSHGTSIQVHLTCGLLS